MDFQLQINNALAPDPQTPGGRMVYFTVGTSYMQGAFIFYNVTGVDEEGRNYIGKMTRSRQGEFLVSELKLQ